MLRNGDTKVQNFSELKKIPLREIWKNEASEFTPWLESNIDSLGEALGMDLVITGREASVGDFSLDLLAQVDSGSKTAIIENQFKHTNHDHLGKLLTYAAGYDASIVVWISEAIREEHRQALEWLNQKTDTETQFFGVVVEILQIDNSNHAINFRLVVFPNEWQKTKRQNVSSAASPRKEKYRSYFQELADALMQVDFTGPRSALLQNYLNFSSGIGEIRYGAMFPQGQKVHAYINIRQKIDANRIKLFNFLEKRKSEIEETFGEELDWIRDQEKSLSRIAVSRDGSIESPDDELEEIREWHIENLLKLKEVFHPEIERALETINSNDEDVAI